MKKFLPLIVVAVFAAWIASTLLPREKSAFHLREFGKLPVLLNGRVQPFDSVGRNALRQIRNNQQVYLGDGKYLLATEWLLEVMAKPEDADGRKVFRIDNDEVKSLLKLPVDNWPIVGGMGNASWAQLSGHAADSDAGFESIRWRLDVWNASAQVANDVL